MRNTSGVWNGRIRAGGIAVTTAMSLVLLGPLSPARATGGTQLWQQRYGGPNSDVSRDVAVNPNGTLVYVTGSLSTPRGGSDTVTIAYDRVTGTEAWIARWGTKLPDAQPVALSVSPDGSTVYVTGGDATAATQWDYATIAYDAITGHRLWVARYDDPLHSTDLARDITVSKDGSRVYVTGQSTGGTGTYDCVTVAYDAASGDQLWVARLTSSGSRDDGGAALTTGPDVGTVFVTGFLGVDGSNPPDSKTVTIAYDSATGNARWMRTYGHAAAGRALAVSPDGSKVYSAGAALHGGPLSDDTLVAYDAATGTKDWAGGFHVRGQGYSYLNSVAVSPDGSRVYANGMEAGGPRGERLVTLAVDQSGSKLWQRTYTGKPNGLNGPAGMVVSPDGAAVYVAGATQDRGTRFDYTTIAYDATTGASAWLARYTGRVKSDDATAIAMSPDGSAVYVTGGSQGHGTTFDFETVAYSTS